MKHEKKIISSISIIFILVFTFFNGYNMVKDSKFSYAIDDDTLWQPLNSEHQLVEAFQYYCKSRDLTIEGSVADAVTTATTGTFNGLCNKLGIDITALQAEIKYATDGNEGIQFLFTSNGITAYNRIFSQFLQDNELEVGDSVNKNIYSGVIFTNVEGNQYFVYIFDQLAGIENTFGTVDINSHIVAQGSKYIYDSDSFSKSDFPNYKNYIDVSFPLVNSTSTKSLRLKYDSSSPYTYQFLTFNSANNSYNNGIGVFKTFDTSNGQRANISAECIVYKSQSVSDTNIYIGILQTSNNGTGLYRLFTISNPTNNLQPMNLTIVSNSINNNNYEGDTIINNEGDVINNNPSNPDTPTPEPDYTPAEDWDIGLPDLNIPNWIISGKENKFPFDIPFNVMYALSLLQAEPEAPHLEGTMDFGFTTWDYDLDLSDFDSVALICRNMEFLAFLTGLMLMTRKLIWG